MTNIKKNAITFIAELQAKRCFTAVIQELVSPNCLFKSVVGKIKSYENILEHAIGWYTAFPDCATKIQKMETYGNVVIFDLKFTATHTNPYVNNVPTISKFAESDFSSKFKKLKPSGIKISQYAEQILVFDRGKIIKSLILEDTSVIYKQLGIEVIETDSSSRDLVFLKDRINSALKHRLTSRELECLAITLSGFSAKHVAEKLSISHRTIETHLCTVYQKLGCYGKQQCIELFYELGLMHLVHELSRFFLT